jgi:hypothetical protein
VSGVTLPFAGGGFGEAVGAALGVHERSANLIFSAVLERDATGSGLYLTPQHRRRSRRTAAVRSESV